MRKVLCLLLLTANVGCATLKAHDPFRNPDGTLNVAKIIQWTAFGIEADCRTFGNTPVGMDICTFGQDAIEVAMAAMDQNPQAKAAAVHGALVDLLARLGPQAQVIQPYVRWAIALLGGQS